MNTVHVKTQLKTPSSPMHLHSDAVTLYDISQDDTGYTSQPKRETSATSQTLRSF